MLTSPKTPKTAASLDRLYYKDIGKVVVGTKEAYVLVCTETWVNSIELLPQAINAGWNHEALMAALPNLSRRGPSYKARIPEGYWSGVDSLTSVQKWKEGLADPPVVVVAQRVGEWQKASRAASGM
jgi:hypothetical protein